MYYLIINKQNKKIIRYSNYKDYEMALQISETMLKGNFLTLADLDEGECSAILYSFCHSGEAPYKDYVIELK